MTKFLVSLAFYLAANLVHANVGVEFTLNKTHALIVFVETLADNPHRPAYLKKVFDESRFNSEASRSYIIRFKQMDEALHRGIDFNGFPQSRHMGFNVNQIILTQSAYAENLQDLKRRSLGLLSFNEIVEYFEILKYFEPIYDQLIWQPNLKAMTEYKTLFEQKARQWKLADRFKSAHDFYNANWPESLNFRIAFYPIPKGAKASSAESMGTFESVGIIIGEKDTPGRFGVIFHELCHSLYESQSEDFQNKFQSFFYQSNSAYGRIGYNYINEVLATALGNGWMYEKAAGKLDDTSWYNDQIIEEMAKAIFPDVKEYAENNKAIDESLIAKYLAHFEKKFPKSIDETNYLFSFVHLITDGEVVKNEVARPIIKKIFRTRSMQTSSPLNHEKTIGYLQKPDELFYLAVISRKQIGQLEDAAKQLPNLFPGVKTVISSKGSGVYRFDNRTNPVTVIILDGDSSLEGIFDEIKKLPTIDLGRWYSVGNKR